MLLYGAARREGCQAADIDDVVQDAWLAFLSHAKDIREPKALPAWLGVTATNAARSNARTRRKVVLFGDPFEETNFQLETDDDWLDELIADVDGAGLDGTLHVVIDQLSPRDQALVAQLFGSGPTAGYRALGERLEMAVGSIGPTRGRVLQKLRCDPALVDAYSKAVA